VDGEEVEEVVVDEDVESGGALGEGGIQDFEWLRGRAGQVGQEADSEGVLEIEDLPLEAFLLRGRTTKSRMSSSRDLAIEYLKRLCGEGC
jgi:hypothetical protein